ncbi:helix-turn-helix domain-containing protein [Mangrovibacterium sp.]|uniref:helix-turn-helix domain-containing protein n=1 Tax=Mangrovibacterium sp. TaxID=1961364 RepID=UPI003562F478
MNSRIKHFMDYKGISSSELADTIGVQRSNVTHVLQGRNKPGFQFISKLLETYPDINAKWLITGDGEMLVGPPVKKPDLFDAVPKIDSAPTEIQQPQTPVEPQKTSEINTNIVPEPKIDDLLVAPTDREIERIVVFYTDQTFKQYLPSK